MSLPIDPEELTREDIGERSATLTMGHDEAVEHVRGVFEDAGFGVPVEFSPSELLREKIDSEAQSASGSRTQSDDSDRDPYYVLGACNPRMADRALDVTEDIGGLFPCNVIVREIEPGVQEVYHVSIMKIARLVAMAPDNDEWEAIVTETSEMVEEAYSNLETQGSGGEKPRGPQGGKQEGSGGSPS